MQIVQWLTPSELFVRNQHSPLRLQVNVLHSLNLPSRVLPYVCLGLMADHKSASIFHSKGRASTMKASAIALIVLSAVILSPAQTNFQAVPLSDVAIGHTYLHAYPGLLYESSNNPPADHDSAGRAAAARVQPLDTTETLQPTARSSSSVSACQT